MSYWQISNQAPSITDWIQTGVYILTAIGLLLNFWYQRRSLQEQRNLTFIEEERDRRAIMPYFELTQIFNDSDNSYDLMFIAKENPGKFLIIQPLTDELSQYFRVFSEFKKDEQFALSLPSHLIEDLSNKGESTKVIFKIDYMDKIARPYQQNVHLTVRQMFLSDSIEYRYIKMIGERNNKGRLWRFFKKG